MCMFTCKLKNDNFRLRNELPWEGRKNSHKIELFSGLKSESFLSGRIKLSFLASQMCPKWVISGICFFGDQFSIVGSRVTSLWGSKHSLSSTVKCSLNLSIACLSAGHWCSVKSQVFLSTCRAGCVTALSWIASPVLSAKVLPYQFIAIRNQCHCQHYILAPIMSNYPQFDLVSLFDRWPISMVDHVMRGYISASKVWVRCGQAFGVNGIQHLLA